MRPSDERKDEENVFTYFLTLFRSTTGSSFEDEAGYTSEFLPDISEKFEAHLYRMRPALK
jgi:hypothetical protein